MQTKKQRLINRKYGLAATGATVLLAAVGAQAESPVNFSLDNVYVSADGGIAFQQDLNILDNTGFNGGGGKVEFDTGWRVSGAVGYRFCHYFSAEIDSGVIWNTINTIGNQTLSGVATAHLEEVPVMASGTFTYPIGNFKPCLGVGVGGAFGYFSGQNFQALGGPSNYRSIDATVVYQLELGASYSVTKNLDLGLAYRFVGTGGHSWNNQSIALKTSASMIHTIEATVTWRF